MIHSENRLAPRMVLIITSHEYRRKLEQTFQNFRIPIYYQCQGHGTAPSEMLDIFGLSGSSRLLTIGLLPKFLVRDLLDALQQRIPLNKRGGGIVLTIPITGLQRPLLQLMNDQLRETIEQKIEERVCSEMSDMQTGAGYAAIWVALSNGYSSDAIDAARSAGAMGGTILKGRRQNSERISRKLGISMQEEEEFVVIVTPREKKGRRHERHQRRLRPAHGRARHHSLAAGGRGHRSRDRREHAVTFLNKNRKCRRQPPAAFFFFYSLQALHFRIPRTSAMTAP